MLNPSGCSGDTIPPRVEVLMQGGLWIFEWGLNIMAWAKYCLFKSLDPLGFSADFTTSGRPSTGSSWRLYHLALLQMTGLHSAKQPRNLKGDPLQRPVVSKRPLVRFNVSLAQCIICTYLLRTSNAAAV